MNNYPYRSYAVIPAESLESENQWMADSGFGEETFSVPLYSGADITHYGCSTLLTDTLLSDFEARYEGNILVFPTSEVHSFDSFVSSLGLSRSSSTN